jgi:hypothetical protein
VANPAVQTGDVLGFYGQGIPLSIGGTDILSVPAPTPPSQGSTINIGSAGFPFHSQNRIYSFGAQVIVNTAPTAVAGGPYLVAVGEQVAFDGSGTDPDGGMLSYQWSSDETGGAFSSVAVDDPDYTAGSTAGIFELSLTVTDPGNLSDTDPAMLVVYDPSGGFVTGGGWIDSPAGACPVFCNDATGKANFGFVAKYKKGANVPDGQTEFQFKAGDLNFHSSSYEWLVVAGNKAQFRGEGTINGEGSYTFMIWADDDDPDTFRIHIWGDTGTAYDNGSQQALGGGSIKVHTK